MRAFVVLVVGAALALAHAGDAVDIADDEAPPDAGVTAGAEPTRGSPRAPPAASPPQLAPHLAALADNAVYAAYAAQLARLSAAPRDERRYVLAQPLSGWGNKIRVVATGLQLALALDRILVVDAALMAPFYGAQFSEPFAPWLTTALPGGRAALLARGAARLVLKSPHKRNDAARCWYEKHDLGACTRVRRGGGPPVLVLEGYFNGDALVHADAALRRDLAAALPGLVPAGGGGVPAAPRTRLDELVMEAVLPGPARALRAAVRAAQAELRWDSATLHVGVHMRAFVDYARRRVSARAIAPGFFACVARYVADAQAALGIGANATLVFVASDRASARPRARAALGHVGRVEWASPVAGGGGFLHSEQRRDARALSAIMTDWWLLSQADLVVGTELSTFGAVAAVRGGHPLALASLRNGRCGRLGRVHLGTVN